MPTGGGVRTFSPVELQLRQKIQAARIRARNRTIVNIKQRETYTRDRLKRIAQNAASNKKHRFKVAARKQHWAEKNRERVRANHLRWRNQNRSHVNSTHREWKRAHPESIRSGAKRYYESNKVRILAYSSRWSKLNPDKRRKSAKRWRESHREQARANGVIGRAIRRSLERGLDVKERLAISRWHKRWRKLKSTPCYWCSTVIKGSRGHADHITPISKGGTHTLSNLCISCAACNHAKYNKSIHEWNKLIESPILI